MSVAMLISATKIQSTMENQEIKVTREFYHTHGLWVDIFQIKELSHDFPTH